jgi:hypothetical protein
MRKRLAIAFLIAAALFAAACSKNGGAAAAGSPSSSAPAPTTSSPTPTPTESPSESPTQSPSAELPDGRHFGFIHSIDLSSHVPTLVFDLAYFLTGDAANKAASKHGEATPVPNDYYIVNDNPRLRTLALDPDVQIELVDWANCCDAVFIGDLQSFADSFQGTPNPSGEYRGGASPYWITVEHGVVVKIREQFLP